MGSPDGHGLDHDHALCWRAQGRMSHGGCGNCWGASSVCAALGFSLGCDSNYDAPLASRSLSAKPARSCSVGTHATTHPQMAASGPYLPSLSLAPSARHYLRQVPDAGNPPVRICAGGVRSNPYPYRDTTPPDAEGSAKPLSPKTALREGKNPPPHRARFATLPGSGIGGGIRAVCFVGAGPSAGSSKPPGKEPHRRSRRHPECSHGSR